MVASTSSNKKKTQQWEGSWNHQDWEGDGNICWLQWEDMLTL
jgi:hypothetical protein